LDDIVDEDANVQDTMVQENAILQDNGVEENLILSDVEGYVDNASPYNGGDQEMVQENQYISGMEEDEGPEDGFSKLIANLGKGEVLEEKIFQCVQEHLNH
jgi:hypothetical protein